MNLAPLSAAVVLDALSAYWREFGRAGGIDIILNSTRTQVFQPDAFEGIGCTLTDKKIVVVKSTQHVHAGFAPIARSVRYVAAPGAIGPDFAAIPFTRRTTPYWPRVANPWATNA